MNYIYSWLVGRPTLFPFLASFTMLGLIPCDLGAESLLSVECGLVVVSMHCGITNGIEGLAKSGHLKYIAKGEKHA